MKEILLLILIAAVLFAISAFLAVCMVTPQTVKGWAITLTIPAIFTALFMFLAYYAAVKDVDTWNGGECPNDETAWVFVREDTGRPVAIQNGIIIYGSDHYIYECPTCGETIEILGDRR